MKTSQISNRFLRTVTVLLVCGVFLPTFEIAAAAPADVARPNILFAIADDWSLHAGAYDTRWIKTPNFDRLAREGVLFTNAYTPMAKCAPSRAIILTGRHLWQNEEAGNHMAYFPAKLKSWPEVLMEHGWHVGITGKGWGPGIANDAEGNPRAITGKPFNGRKAKPPASGMSNNNYAANFVDFLDAAPEGAPWCFWYGATEPHRGYEFQSGVNKGGKQLDDIDRVPAHWPDHETVRHDILDYAFEVEHVDSHLGRMIDELDKRGLLNNTVIIVTSDHGMPFPRVKGYAYHDSNHVPLAVHWPAGIKHPGRVIDDFVDFTDLAATILDYAGIAHAKSGMLPITGQSWRPLLENDQSGRILPQRDHVLIGKERTDVGRPHNWGYPIRGIVTEEFLYLRNYAPSRWPAGNPETGYLDTDGSPTKTLILELGRRNRSNRFWQLNFGLRPADELYDLRTDADCVHNLAAEASHNERLAELRQRMETELKAQDDPRMFGRGHVFDEYKPTRGDGFYESFKRGEKVDAGWVNETDFEQEPIRQQARVADEPRHLNIVFILADDLGWADIGYHDSDIRTPHLDRLAAGGTRLNRHYVYPTCSPTRVALLSGRFPSRFGVLGPLGSTTKMRGEDALLTHALRKLGYRTHISGKWHIGETPEHRPLGYGFETSYGYLRGQIDPYTHRYKFGDHVTWHRNDEFIEEEGHVTDLISDEAARIIESAGEKPFFLYVAHHSPHYPLNEPPKWIAPYEQTIDDVWRRHYAAAVTHLDDGVGRIVAALEQAGLREKTLIVFSSDNGGQQSWDAPQKEYNGRYAAHTTLGNNQPLRGWKGDLYEGGIRVPAFVNWPGHIPKGRVFDSPTHVVDWLPTLIRAAGGNPEDMKAAEGIDLWPALLGESSAIAERVMYWKTPSAAAVRQGDWKLIRYRRDNRSELFDLKSDPLEHTDMAEREPERVRALSDLLDRAAENDQ